MSLIEKIARGQAHIGQVGYNLVGHLFFSLTKNLDDKRLKTQQYDYSDLTKETYSYMNDKKKYHLFDIHRRKDGFCHKGTLLVIHGGGLMYGDKDLNRNSIRDFCRLGYTVVAPSYSLAPKKNYYTQIHELFAFYTYISENKNKLKLDLENVFVMGDSAGGLLAFTTIAISLDEEKQRIFNIEKTGNLPFRAVCLISSMCRLMRDDGSGLCYKVAVKKRDSKLECYPYLQTSINLIDSHFIPSFIITSDKDMMREDSLLLNEKFNSLGVEHQFYDYTSKDIELGHVFPITYPRYEESKEVFSNLDTFFQQHSFFKNKVVS